MKIGGKSPSEETEDRPTKGIAVSNLFLPVNTMNVMCAKISSIPKLIKLGTYSYRDRYKKQESTCISSHNTKIYNVKLKSPIAAPVGK